MTTKLSRRDFIKKFLNSCLVGVALAPVGLRQLAGAAQQTSPKEGLTSAPAGEKAGDAQWAFLVDINKCIGCGRCILACKLENRVPLDPDSNRTWVERYAVAENGAVHKDSPDAGVNSFPPLPETDGEKPRFVKSFFVPKLCNQCDNPPCVQVCPVAATYKTSDGIVLIDQDRCIGCRYCIIACPYGARYFLEDAPVTPTGQSRVADKCTWCYHRITKGLKPACVEVCPVGARQFGDLRDETNEVTRAVREKEVHVLKPALGTKPKVYYLGLRDWV